MISRSRRALLAGALLVLASRVVAEDRVLELPISGADNAAKPRILSVLQNDRVVLHLTADRPVHIHLHGYDIESDVAPNHDATLRFMATATGRFPIEIHSHEPHHQRPLAYVEVRPR
jgi:hypothetical protein